MSRLFEWILLFALGHLMANSPQILLAQNSPTVRIRATSTHSISHGTGVIIDAQAGLILTAAHVVQNPTPYQITFDSFDRYFRPITTQKVQLLAADTKADLALLHFSPHPKLTEASLLAPPQLQLAQGDAVVSIGATHGQVPSLQNSRIQQHTHSLTAAGPEGEGRSGGGLYFHGWLIGLRRGWQPVQQLEVYSSLQDIHQFLKPIAQYKPLLIYCFDPAKPCLPCRHFEHDIKTNAEFASQLHQHYRLYRLNLQQAVALGRRLQIHSVPTFLAGSHPARLVGYQSANELLKALSLSSQPVALSPDAPATSSAATSHFKRSLLPLPQCDCALQFAQLQAQLQQIQIQIKQLQSRQNSAPTLSQLQQLESQLQQLRPLLKRRLVIEDQNGTVLSEQTYQPDQPIRLRGIYKTRSSTAGATN